MAKVSLFLARAGLVALALSTAGAVGPAFAASGGSSNGGSSGASTPSCQSGYVYDANKKTCVKASSGLFDDKQLYAQGRASPSPDATRRRSTRSPPCETRTIRWFSP